MSSPVKAERAPSPASPSAVRAAAARLVSTWREKAIDRAKDSKNDVTADIFSTCAEQLDRALKEASALDEPLSPAEYGAQEHIAAHASTVRRWCDAGLLECERVGREIRIRRGAEPPAHHTRRKVA